MSEALERSYAVKPDLNYRAPVKPISAMGQLGNALAGKVAGFAQRISGAIPADPDMPIIPKQLQVVAISAGSPAPKVEPTAEEVVEDFLSGLPEMTPFPTGEEAAEPEPLGELDDLLARAARASYEKNDEAARALFERAYGVAQTRGERERVHQLMTFRGLTEVVFRDQPFQKW
jgi:predicted component of type VI protein secretion system